MILLDHLPALLAAFFASGVEFVEALTVVLAVGAVRGWRPALTGALGGFLLLALIVLLLGPLLTTVSLRIMRLLVGILLLLFGGRWLAKAVKRAAGMLPLRDEDAAYARETESLRKAVAPRGIDKTAIATAFNITMLEGIEVVFIVLAIGAGSPALLPAAIAGAAAALGLVMLAGLLLHRPLAKVPENALKFGTGVILVAFGLFWLSEAAGLRWPDAWLFGLIGLVLAGALAAVAGLRLMAGGGSRKGLGAARFNETRGGGI